MTCATLHDVLTPALRDGYAVAGLVVLSWEEAVAYVDAAEAENLPVILQAGPGFRAHMPLEVIGPMFRYLAERASVPVVAHLDHSTDLVECKKALDVGFTSIMFDGSKLPLAENVSLTTKAAELAHSYGASCEAEIGFVGYAEGKPGALTDVSEAKRMAEETGVDALAISVGNVHLQTEKAAHIDRERLDEISAATKIPLVLHGGSGISSDVRVAIARDASVCKFNIGTELRQAYGRALRDHLAKNPKDFDRISIAKAVYPQVTAKTRGIIGAIGPRRA
ncbi:MAG: class II fructose-bisphosphate aldolase [Pseudomonadota bacterium]